MNGECRYHDCLSGGVHPNAVSPLVATSIPVVAHALSVPRRDSSRRLGPFQPQTTKQTQSRRTRMETTPSRPTEALPRQPGMDAAPLSPVHAACLKQASRFTTGTAPRTPGGSLWRSAASSVRAGPGVGRQRAARGGSLISSNHPFLLGYSQSLLAPKPVQPAHCISLSTCSREAPCQ